MTETQIKNRLKKVGYDEKSIIRIIEEAKNSSNPEYVYNYWGVKINK